ncbi:MAG: hypothetical protein OEV44_01130 [Spirochaetota bacterium]|nr:hypothetical protein [Spirochaetota bacterium]
MTGEQDKLVKLARIQKELIDTTIKNKGSADITIKIRDGVIVWAETSSIKKLRVNFKL